MKYFTLQEAAALLGVKRQRVSQLIQEKKMEVKMFGHNYMLTTAQLKEMRNRNTKPGRKPRAKT